MPGLLAQTLAGEIRSTYVVLMHNVTVWGWIVVALAAGWCVIMALYEHYRKD